MLILKKGKSIIEVKEGFSWPAFFFGWLWGWYKHIGWQRNSVMFLAGLISYAFWPVGLAIYIYFGFKGNEWLVNAYKEKGYK